jgi:hypothetical protein
MPRYHVMSTIQFGGTLHRAGQQVDMTEAEARALPRGSVRPVMKEGEKSPVVPRPQSAVDARLSMKVNTPPPGEMPALFGHPADSPVESEDAGEREKSIIERQARPDLRHPDTEGMHLDPVTHEQDGALTAHGKLTAIEPGDGKQVAGQASTPVQQKDLKK